MHDIDLFVIFLSSDRWPLCNAARSLSSPNARTDGPWSQSFCPHGRSHGNCPGSSGGSHHCYCTAGGNVPDLAGADCVSALSAGNRHPHLPRRRPHEHTLLPLLLLCRVSRSQVRSQAGKRSNRRLIKACLWWVLSHCENLLLASKSLLFKCVLCT